MSARDMATAAGTLLDALTDEQRAQAALPFADDAARRWIEYRPRARPGACLADLSTAARKAAHRLLATALGPHAYAQAMAIVSLEEVLDRVEGWRRGRHSGDYWVSVFGDPAGDAPWSWRFEGHHVSVTMTVADGAVSPAPVFLGANPHRVDWAGHAVSRPLAPEEDLACALLEAAGPAGRAAAVVADEAPYDIRSGPGGRARRSGWNRSACRAVRCPRRRARCSTGSSTSTWRGCPPLAAEAIGERALRVGRPDRRRAPGTTTGSRARTC